MNKIFRIVWNQSLQTWVVVSELASRHGKPTTIVGSVKKTSKTLKSFFLNSLSLSVLLALPTAANAYVAFNYTDEDGTVHNVDTGVIGGDSSGTTVRRKAQASDDPKIQPLNYRTPGNMTFATPDDTTLSTAATGSGGSKLYTENTGMTQSGIAIGNFANTISKAGQSRTNGGVASSGIAIGNYATAEGGMSIALGSFTHASDIGAIALGTAARAAAFNSLAVMRQASAAGNMSMAIGTAAYAKGTGGIAMGQSATATGNRSVAIGSANADIKLVDGGLGSTVGMTTYTEDSSTKADGDSSVAVGSVARAGGDRSIAIGANARVEADNTSADNKAPNAIAIGSSARTNYENNIAIGNQATATSPSLTYSGVRGNNGHPGILEANALDMYYRNADSEALKGFGTVSVGDRASAMNGGVALGGNAIANTVSVSVGLQSNSANSGVSVGTASYSDNASVAAGRQAYSDKLGVAVGTTAVANAISTVAVGASATANAKGAIAIGGRDTSTNTLTNGDYDYSLENSTKATGASSISIGTKASASKANAIAQGTLSNAAGTRSIAIGTEAVAGNKSEQVDTIAIGTKSLANTVGGIALGGEAKSTGNGATAVGSYANALATASSAFGNHANASAEAATAIGRQSLAGRNASALGTAAKATGDSSIAIGAGAQAQGANAISIGTGNVVSGNNSGAIGDPTTISGEGTYSLGNNNGTIAASNSGVFGNDNTFAEGANDSIRVIGNHNTIQTSNVQILGNDITAGVANSAYIGSSSRAAAGNTVGSKNKKKDGSDGNTTTAGDGGTVTNATVGAITYGGFAGAQAHGVVTVGAAGNERRIQNVAAGEISATSTDAINGSQLYATNNVVNNVANSVKNVLGGDAAVDPNTGNITYGNTTQNGSGDTDGVGGTGKTTIDEAIKHVNQGWKATVSNSDGGEQSGQMEDAIQPGETLTFDAGKNIKLTQSEGKISIATKDDVNLNSVTANTVTTGNTSMNTDGLTITKDGKPTKVEAGKVTGLDERNPTDNKVDYGTGENAGRAATESAVKSVDDKVNAAEFGLKAQDTKEVKKKLNNTIEVVGADSNISTKVEDSKLKIELAKTLDLGENGSVTINGNTLNKDGLTLANNGPSITKDGISAGNKKVTNVADGEISETSKDAVNGSQLYATNKKVDINTQNIAKGTKYAGDVGENSGANTFTRQLGEVTNVKGGVTEAEKLSDNNIGVVSNNTDTLTVKLAKSLAGLTDATFGTSDADKTVINKDGVTINKDNGSGANDPAKTVSLTENGLNNGDNKITNVASGLDGQELDKASGDTLKNATNVGDLQKAANDLTDKGFALADDKNTQVKKKLGEAIQIKGEDGITVTADSTDNSLKLALGNTVTVGEPENGGAGQAGTINVVGKDGKDGVSIKGDTGAEGKPGISIAGKDGVDGVTLTTKVDGQPGVDGKGATDGTNTKPRLEVNGEEVATLNDGLKFQGDKGDVINKKLNETLAIKGKLGSDAEVTDKNLRVDSEGGELVLKMAKTLTELTSATFGNDPTASDAGTKPGVKIDGDTGAITSNNAAGNTITINNPEGQITGVTSGLGSKTISSLGDNAPELTNVANIGDLKNIADTGWKLQTNSNTETTVKIGDTVQVVDGANTKVSTVTDADGKHTFHVDVTGLPVAYTDANGNPLVKVGDKFYKASDVTNGVVNNNAEEATPTGTTLVSKDGAAEPQTLDNVKSAIDPDGNKTDSDFTDALETAATNSPNKAVNVKDLKNTSDALTNKGFALSDDSNTEVKKNLGEAIQIKGEDGITVTADTANNSLKLALGNEVTVGEKAKDGTPGQAGTINVVGKDGKDGVSIKGDTGPEGKPGISIAGKDGANGVTLTTKVDGKPGVDGTTNKPRLEVNDEEVATLNDGLKFKGNGDETVAKKLNETLTVKGGLAQGEDATDANTRVDVTGGELVVKLAKNLTDLTSATFTDNTTGDSTEITGGAITTTNNDGSNVALRTATETSFIGGPNDTVKLSNEGLDNGNNQITNVASGLGDTALEDATGDTLTNAANIADVKKARTTVTSSDDSILVGETTEEDGHTNYDLTVDKQKIVEGAQLPVVYTDAEGNKLYKQADGSFNTQADGQGKRVEAADVIASMNSGDGSTSTPTKLANVGSSIADQKGDTYLDKLDAANTANANNAVNVSDLKNTADALTNKGFGLTAQDGNAVTKKLGETVEVVGGAEDAVTTTAKNVRTVVNNGKIEVQVAEAPEFKEVTVTNGKDGADGKSVVVKPDAIVFNGVDGVDGKDGTDGQNGQVSVKVEKGEPGLAGNDGKDGESKTRIVYEKPNGDKETVATLNDGLKFKGNGDKVVEKKLNETLTVKGGLAEDKDVTDANTRVDVDDEGNLVVKMAKELTDLTSAVFGNNPVDNKGVENKPGVNVDGSTGAITTQNAAGNQIVINNPAGQITGVESGLGDTKLEEAKGDTLKNVANIGDLQNVSKKLTDTGWKLQTNDGTESTVKLGETVQVVDGANTKVSTVTDANGKHTFHVDVTGLPVAYTDEDGNPLVKVGDKFYKASDVTDGVVNQDAPEATPTGTTLVSKDGTATPQTLDNVKSVIETPTEDKDFSTVLKEAADSKPNSAVNVSDLKNTSDALTAKGFGLTDDSGNKVTQELGKQIQIKGVDGVTVTAKDAEQDGRRLEVSLSGDVRVSGKDGKDGTIGVKGADGRDGTTITKDAIVFNGVDGVNGKDGADGKDGQASIKVEKGAKGLDGNDGKDGESKTRIVYEKPNGEKEEVATLNDGLRFEGDTGETIDKKLNTTLKLSGKASENGGLESDAAVTDKNLRVDSINGQLVIQMAQALRDLTSATFGNPENPTSDNPVTTITNNGMTINNGTPAETVSLTKDGLNNGGNQITNVASGLGDKDISSLEDNDPTLTNAANIGDLKNVSDNLTNTGWKLQTNDGNAQTVKLGETVQVVDGANTKVSTITSKDGVHSYHIDVTGLPIVYTDEQGNPLVKVGDTFYKASDLENGLPKEGAQPATPAGTSLVAQDGSATPQTLDNVKSVIAPQNGEDFTKALEKAAESKPNSAVNVSDLHNTANALTENLTQKGFGLTDDSGKEVTQELGKQIQIKGKDGVTVTADANDKSLTVALEGDVRVSGKDGKDGTIGVKGADGRDGTTITKDAIVFNGVDGVNGKDGADGKDGQASIKVEKGAKGLDGNDGKDGESKTRIVYEKPNGEKEEVATLNDGLIFQGNGTDTVAKKLNETLQIKGGLDNNAKATDANTRVDVEDGALVVKMAKDLTDLDSATFGKDGDNTVINKDGITITNSNPTKPNVSLTENGLSNGDNKITNVAEGTDDTDAVNVKQLKEAAAAATTTVESSDGTIDVSRPQPQPEDGHIHYDLKVNSQKVVENAQLPVVYTNKDGDKVYKQADGSFNTKPDGSGTKVEAGDIIASMNSGDGSTTSPTKLANVGTSIGDISPTVDGKAVPADKANFLDQLAEAGKDGSKVANNAVNVSDLHNTADALVNKGFNIAADKGGDDNVRLGETVKFTDPNKNIITTVKDNEIQFALNSEVSIGGKDGKPGSIGVKGADGKDAVAINGADGGSIVVGGKDGVPGKDGAPGIAINGKDGSIGIAGKDGSNAGVTVAQGEKGLAGNDGKDGESKTRIVYTKPDGNTEQVATLNDGIKYQGDVGNAQMTLNNTTQIVGGVTNAEDLTDNNIGVVAKQDGKNAKLTVKLAKDLKGLNSVTTTDAAGNSTTVQGNGVTISGPNAAGNNSTVSLTTNGLNNGGNRITNVADGKDDTDAVNVRQLKGAVGNINNNINKLNKDLRAGIAGATATAGLPQVYMPGKSMVAAAAGTYKGQGAIAVGYSRASDNGKVILKLTGNANTRGDFGGSVGVGYQW
ncbi:YadA-like family protein [Avibacterium sp. 20-15]|uniref:YadA-like family protein n=1 Tax=unclassified Avibacterium TaxID=2685287 RepID=UPI002025D6B9|nr:MULTISPECIES: YadA-like family protein [unclassified Avibacterium]MCW9732104.1 YadA-like family protein [Avibacterium sp. 20-15]URL04282.1 YadA-like family protein [Avibacterium sp. 20-132]